MRFSKVDIFTKGLQRDGEDTLFRVLITYKVNFLISSVADSIFSQEMRAHATPP